MRLIVLEGPDCAGKSTLAGELCKLGYQVQHNGPPPPWKDLTDFYMSQLQTAEQKTVFDRLHLGEYVYGPILRNRRGISIGSVIEINNYIESHNGVVVLCIPPWENVLDEWIKRQESEHIKKFDQLKESYYGFIQLADRPYWSRSLITTYDYTKRAAAPFAKALAVMEST